MIILLAQSWALGLSHQLDHSTGVTPVTIEPTRDESERPIPNAWRATIEGIVASLIRQDPVIAADIPDVDAPSLEKSQELLRSIPAYGAVTSVPLPEDTWDSSVSIWTGSHWDCLVDLWTAEEGRSDLCLELKVVEDAHPLGYRICIHLIYVP